MAKDLEEILREIQRIKADHKYLVGTAAIFQFIRQRRKIYDMPQAISRAINDRLARELPRVSYPATPERVVCIDYTISDGETRDPYHCYQESEIVDLQYPFFQGANKRNLVEGEKLTDEDVETILRLRYPGLRGDDEEYEISEKRANEIEAYHISEEYNLYFGNEYMAERIENELLENKTEPIQHLIKTYLTQIHNIQTGVFKQ
ncbi:MAG: hypothetical protein RL557_819, partial [archaeon]